MTRHHSCKGYRVVTVHARLPFKDLESWITIYHGVDEEILKGNTHRVLNVGLRQTARRIARLTGVTTTEVHRWMNDDLPYFKADKAASGLGVHAEAIWPGFADIEPYIKEHRPCSSLASCGGRTNPTTSTSPTTTTP